MSSIKRIGIILIVAVAIALTSASFSSNDILNRSVIIGMGLDLAEDNQLVLTAEVVSPGNGSEQVGTFSKTVTVKGQTISQAVQQISQKTGKEASLGQCSLVILGESLYKKVNFSQIIDFFINSYNFKENSALCCAKGSAEDMLNYGEALAQSVSLAIASTLQSQAKSIAIPTNSLLQYARSQKELTKTGFINYVEFVNSQNTDAQNPDKPQGYFKYDCVAVFRDNEFVDVLEEKLTRGLALCMAELSGESFVVTQQKDGKEEKSTFIVGQKKVKGAIADFGVTLDIQLHGKLARTDDFGSHGILTAQTEYKISQQIVDEIVQTAKSQAQAFLSYQQQYNVDLIGLHETFRQKYGSKSDKTQFDMADMPVTLTVSVKQN